MKWFLASIGLLVVIVVFSMAALDQKNVVWVDGRAECPHCRHDVRSYSNVCAECGRAFDWQVFEADCEACLSEHDAAYLKRRFLEHEKEFEEILRSENVRPEAIPELLLYARALHSGGCGFCGGTGRWLAAGVWEGSAENGNRGTKVFEEWLEGRCPVCFGSGRCVLCGGDHRTEFAREAAVRDLRDLENLFNTVDPGRDPDSAKLLFEALERFVEKHSGRVEVGRAPSLHPLWAQHPGVASWRREIVERLFEKLP